MVEKGVTERTRLTQLYEKRKEDLEKQHEEVRQSVEEERQKVIIFFFQYSTTDASTLDILTFSRVFF